LTIQCKFELIKVTPPSNYFKAGLINDTETEYLGPFLIQNRKEMELIDGEKQL
jgi:hypothetical protein